MWLSFGRIRIFRNVQNSWTLPFSHCTQRHIFSRPILIIFFIIKSLCIMYFSIKILFFWYITLYILTLLIDLVNFHCFDTSDFILGQEITELSGHYSYSSSRYYSAEKLFGPLNIRPGSKYEANIRSSPNSDTFLYNMNIEILFLHLFTYICVVHIYIGHL